MTRHWSQRKANDSARLFAGSPFPQSFCILRSHDTGLDRSLAAWAALRSRFPEQGDAILEFQLWLVRIRQATEKLFPNARAFVRPGFDENVARLEVGG
jgi:hypothetical protein